MVGGGGNKVVATLRADGKVVYPTEGPIGQLATLMNYKIRTEGELGSKSLNTLSVPTTVVDLGKQLLQFARDNDLKGVKNMLMRGAPFTSDWLGMSALHFAAMNNQYEICDDLLKNGINKDSKTKVDRTPLHLACFHGNERIVELLLAKNCAVNPRDMLRMSPLHWAIEKGHKTIVRMLLKRNADVTLVSKFGKTPIALAVMTEQADILADLEAARQSQASKKYNEEHEKETSDAVNSIMGLNSDIIEEPDAISKMDIDTEDELTNPNDYAKVKISDFENIKETGILDNSTINLLKSHGISMQDDDGDSKDLLATALQNGRQLVLSEGGKLLLNDANMKTYNNNTSINNNNSIAAMRIKNEVISPVPSTQLPRNTARPNIISKAKDNPGMGKNKNIRIISLNDFKKLYGNTNLKAMQKLPASLANSRVVRQLAEDAKIDNAERKMFANVRHVRNRQAKMSKTEIVNEDNIIEEDEDPMSSIIQVGPTDSEPEISDTEKSPKSTMRIIPAKCNEQMGVSQVRQLSTHNADKIVKSVNEAMQTTSSATTNSTSVIPLLSMPEICRQLLELRKQNDELRRKFDLAQKEKEEMRQRLERLEELMLVEKTDDYTES